MTTRDLSRFLLQPRKHYAAARVQQGRTFLDSDQGEGASLEQEEWRRAVLDIVGPRGTPDEGFSLGSVTSRIDASRLLVGDIPSSVPVSLNGAAPVDLLPIALRIGTFYLGGMRLAISKPELVYAQSDFLQMRLEDLGGLLPETHALLYLEAWEQEISAIEDEEILEHALGGPDTTVRVRRFRRVRTVGGLRSGISCADAFREQMQTLETSESSTFNCRTYELESNGRLQLAFQTGSDGNPCTPDPPTQFLGTENETIRIMLTAPDRYVWAFDNAAPLYRATMGDLGSMSESRTRITIKMQTPFKDEEHKPHANQVVEVVPFAAVIDSHPTVGSTKVFGTSTHIGVAAAEIGLFASVATPLDEDGTFTLDVSEHLSEFQALVTRWDPDHPYASQLNSNDENNPGAVYLRFWHERTATQPVEIPIGAYDGEPLGKTGIIPRLLTPGRRGDFWIAALRPETPDRIVPYDLMTEPLGAPPHGPHHFFAPLAVFQQSKGVVTELHDCRPRMRKLVDGGCATFTVGDGRRTIGDFTKIQDAVDALPPTGGRVFILPGLYQQNAAIEDRTDIIIEGCGEETIIETPTTRSAATLISVQSSTRITLSNLHLHAVEQPAVAADATTDLQLSGLSAVAYVEVSGSRKPGADTAEAALLQLSDCPNARVNGVHVEPARRSALLIKGQNSTGTTVVGLSAVGANGTNPAVSATNPSKTPMIQLQNLSNITLRDIALQTFGQVGIAVETTTHAPVVTVRMSRLTIVAERHQAQAMRMAVDIHGQDIILEDSDITLTQTPSDDAAVVIYGNNVVIRGNRITTESICIRANANGGCDDDTTPAWGGIQIRGGSSAIQILGNHISGGLGHGITLGSVRWSTGSDPWHREGAGKAQIIDGISPRRFVSGSLGAGYVEAGPPEIRYYPSDEGAIEGVTIADNRIEGMSTNGISTLTVLGLATAGATDLFEVRNTRIERNTISGNVRHPYQNGAARADILPFPAARHDHDAPQSLKLSIPVLPLGGIVLASATARLTISGNTIMSNGPSPTLPVNGIFVLNGDGILIKQNRIAANGALASAGSTDTLSAGIRAGIAVMFAGTDAASSTTDLSTILQVTSDELHSLNTSSLALRIADNSVQQPEGRALHAVAAGAVSIDGNFLSSQGNHGAATQEDESVIGDVVFVQNLGAPWEATDAGSIPEEDAHNSQFQFSPDYTDIPPVPAGAKAYLTQSSASPRLFTGAGGSLLFTNNQVVYDWDVKIRPPEDGSTPLSFFAVVLMTLDHLGCIGNQFSMRVDHIPANLPPPLLGSLPPPPQTYFPVQPLLSHALMGGATTQVARNRFAANLQAASLSAITTGEILNITVFNQATLPIWSYRWPRVLTTSGAFDEQAGTHEHQPNAVLFTPGPGYESVYEQMREQIRRFFDLLHKP